MNPAPTQKKYFVDLRSFFLASFLFVTTNFLLAFWAFGAPGDLDTGYNASLSTPATGRIEATAIQPDGKVLVYGNFSIVSGTPVNPNPIGPTLIRINADGTLDTSFIAPFIAPSAQVIPDIALQSNGKIIVAGGFPTVGGQTMWGIARLNQDGSLDPTFTVNNFTNSYVYDVDVLPDDKIIVPYSQGLRRLLPNGQIDPTFTGDSTPYIEVGFQADGKILAATSNGNNLVRFSTGGSPEATLATFDARVWDIRTQSDGKILVGGQFTTLNGFSRKAIARLNADGSGDATFTSPFSAGFVFKVIPQSDGTIYAAGSGLTTTTPSNSKNIYRLNADGSLDTGFVQNVPLVVWDMERQSDGKVIIAGNLGAFPSTPAMYRLNLNGSIDTTFNSNFGFSGMGRKIYIQPDGKALVAGRFYLANNATRIDIVRFNTDGTVDTGFDASSSFPIYTPQDLWSSIDLQTDGKIIAGDEYSASNSTARRLNSSGLQDVSFDSNTVFDIKVLNSGKILMAGGIGSSGFVRLYNSNGIRDNTFNVNINAPVRKIAVQPDGKILIVGVFTAVNTVNRGYLARLNADGTLDTTFDTSTGANSFVFDIVPLISGQILIGGAFTGYNFTNRPYVARLNSNGSLDTSFTPTPNDSVQSIKVQPNNRILIGGLFTSVNATSRGRIARLNQDGTPDGTFNPGSGADGPIYDIEYQNDGKILIAGDFGQYNGVLRAGIARLQNTTTTVRTPFDYDGDGKADVSVFRASENNWYVLRSSDFAVTQTTFAIAGDMPVPADYDGDGKTDIAIFRPSNGDWWWLSSVTNQQINAHWGVGAEIPLPSDFDGDGKADYIVYLPASAQWLRASSAGGASSNRTFGQAGDKPVIGDFDGDGKSDVAIYRPSDGNWWWQSSVDNVQRATKWGLSTDIPAPADYDGDGKTDFAVFRPSTGVWYIYNSATQTPTIGPFGLTGDKPVPADYDGDGKADIAVYRPSDGIWYLLRSTSGFTGLRFGIATDTPTQNAFLQ